MKYDDELTERDLYMYQRGVLREYVSNHGILPSEIRHQLYQWVDSGHDVHDNPWGIRSTETGLLCDYLEALSILESRRTWMAGMKPARA